MVKILRVACPKCKVSSVCPKTGSSPLHVKGSLPEYCQIVGGYGREPVNPAILSQESHKAWSEKGPCLTIVYIPDIDPETNHVVMKLTKIFGPPVLHEREKIAFNMEVMYPKSYKS
jgi:hypothetical protein